MSQDDYFPACTMLFGRYRLELSHPPHDLRFGDDNPVSLNNLTGDVVIGETPMIWSDLIDDLQERIRENGGRNKRTIVERRIAEIKAYRWNDAPANDPTPAAPEYGVLFPDAESADEFKRHHDRKNAPERFEQESPAKPIRIVSDSQLPEIELTRFTKHGGPLTKRLSLASDGTLVKDGSACVMTRGTAERVKVIGINALAALIKDMTPSQAFTPGSLRSDLPNKVGVTTKDKLVINGVAQPNFIARTGANTIYCGPAFALLDYDSKGIPAGVEAELQRRGGFWPTLETVLPALKNTAHVTRCSTSAGLARSDTGESLPGSDGMHAYVAVKDGADCERFLRTLHDRCWLASLGWYVVSSSGALLERSIIDRMVGGPEHLMFEGGPVLVPPLIQDKKSRLPTAVDGGMLDTVATCGPLTIVEHSRLEELKAKESERLAPERAKVREAFVAVQAKKLIARTGMAENAARLVITRQCDGVLRPDVVLSFDEETLGECTVGDVLADPARYEGETLADPLEGIAYGRCVAKIMRRADGTPWIHSFAHGRIIYELKHDAASVREVIGTDPPPLKWSDLRYVFDIKEDCNGKEAIQA